MFALLTALIASMFVGARRNDFERARHETVELNARAFRRSRQQSMTKSSISLYSPQRFLELRWTCAVSFEVAIPPSRPFTRFEAVSGYRAETPERDVESIRHGEAC